MNFFSLYEFNNAPTDGTVYEMYLVALAVFSVKFQVYQERVMAIQDHDDDYDPLPLTTEHVNIVKSFSALPDSITSVNKCIGQVRG